MGYMVDGYLFIVGRAKELVGDSGARQKPRRFRACLLAGFGRRRMPGSGRRLGGRGERAWWPAPRVANGAFTQGRQDGIRRQLEAMTADLDRTGHLHQPRN